MLFLLYSLYVFQPTPMTCIDNSIHGWITVFMGGLQGHVCACLYCKPLLYMLRPDSQPLTCFEAIYFDVLS